MNFKLSALQETAIFLLIYCALAAYFNFSEQILLHLAATLGFALILFYPLRFFKKAPKNILNTVISALIIFLVLHYGTGFEAAYIALAATAIAMFSKFFLQWKGTSIVNPAAFALLIISFFERIEWGSFVSWWGSSYQGYISLALIIFWILWGLRKWNKSKILITFLVMHAFAILFLQGFESFKFIFTDATIYFFAGIMLVDPKSSPVDGNKQIAFAVLAVLVYNLFSHLQIANHELWAIIIANLYNFALRYRAMTALR